MQLWTTAAYTTTSISVATYKQCVFLQGISVHVGEKLLTRKLMFNPACFHSQWNSWLTGIADKFLLFVRLESCLYTRVCVCVEWNEQKCCWNQTNKSKLRETGAGDPLSWQYTELLLFTAKIHGCRYGEQIPVTIQYEHALKCVSFGFAIFSFAVKTLVRAHLKQFNSIFYSLINLKYLPIDLAL